MKMPLELEDYRMAAKREEPEEIVGKLQQVEELHGQGMNRLRFTGD
jgi:hypothetical protein